MWKANAKTATLLLSMDCLFPKTDKCEMLPLEIKQSRGKLCPPTWISRLGGVILELLKGLEISK
jgi:hypothetical protein